MGGLQTYSVFTGSLIQLDGSPWRDAVTGDIPPVSFPGISTGNVTKGSHHLKISLPGFQDFEGDVNICEHGLTEVMVQQASVNVSPSAVAGTVPATTNVPGFEFIAALLTIGITCVLRNHSF